MKPDTLREKLIDLSIEKSKINREESRLIIDKGITVYFLLLVLAILGLVTKTLRLTDFVLLVCLSLIVLIITGIPYIKTVITEKKRLDGLMSQIQKGSRK